MRINEIEPGPVEATDVRIETEAFGIYKSDLHGMPSGRTFHQEGSV
jgi:threonine dehydrogenase-like Zn-dependent dehydrogenase